MLSTFIRGVAAAVLALAISAGAADGDQAALPALDAEAQDL